MIRDAIFNADRNKRYLLVRDWSNGERIRTLNLIGLNPAKADAVIDDMTVRKDIGFARRWGFNQIVLTNLVPVIATDPWDLPAWSGLDPVNSRFLRMWLEDADMVVACWGAQHAALYRRIAFAEHVSALFSRCRRMVHCIGKTAQGMPRHPSRSAYTESPEIYQDFSLSAVSQ